MVGKVAQRALVCVGYGHNALCGFLFAHLLLKQVFEQAESNGWLGGCARLGDVDKSEVVAFHQVDEVVQIVLAYVVAGKKHLGAALLVGCKAVA